MHKFPNLTWIFQDGNSAFCKRIIWNLKELTFTCTDRKGEEVCIIYLKKAGTEQASVWSSISVLPPQQHICRNLCFFVSSFCQTWHVDSVKKPVKQPSELVPNPNQWHVIFLWGCQIKLPTVTDTTFTANEVEWLFQSEITTSAM